MKVRNFYPLSVIRQLVRKPVNELTTGEQAALQYGIVRGIVPDVCCIGQHVKQPSEKQSHGRQTRQ